MTLRPLALALLLLPAVAAAQSPEAEVMATVNRLFDGMRAADTSAVAAVFHPVATLYSVGPDRKGTVAVRTTPVEQFVSLIGEPHAEVYDERLGAPEVRIDGDLATVWVPFAFYLGDAFSHCGMNAFQLARLDGAWQIIHVADTRRRTGCDPSLDVPPEATQE